MRIPVAGAERVKAAAKILVQALPSIQLAHAHESLARAFGYRDWHDFRTHAAVAAVSYDQKTAQAVVGGIAADLNVSLGDVQFALSKSRALGDGPWPLDCQLQLQASLLRERVFGPPGRGKPGTVVKVRAEGRAKRVAYLKGAGRPARVVYDEGPGWVADFEIVTPRSPLPDFIPLRLWLPYGHWTLRDGSEVIYSRDYLPMWRITSARIERLDPWLWIEGIQDEHWFFRSGEDWTSGEAQARARRHLSERRISELPRLVDALPHLLDPEVEAIAGAAERLRHAHGEPKPPPFAQVNTRLAQ